MTSIAHTRQVNVTGTICGVDVASKSLEARIGQHGAAGSFPNNAEGIAELGAFCRSHQAELVAMEATGAVMSNKPSRCSPNKVWGWPS